MAQDQRPPVFELHIRPMFRLLDREHMLTLVEPGFDLWELERVWEMRNDILLRLRGEGSQNMPGLQLGGPWPAEWIALFERWTQNPTADDIGHHLVLAQPDGPYQLQPLSGDKRRLQAKVIAPTAGCRAWFELDSITSGQRAVHALPRAGAAGATARRDPAPSARAVREGRRDEAHHP